MHRIVLFFSALAFLTDGCDQEAQLASQQAVFRGRLVRLDALASEAQDDLATEIRSARATFAAEHEKLPAETSARSLALGKLNQRSRAFITEVESKLEASKRSEAKVAKGRIQLGTRVEDDRVQDPKTVFVGEKLPMLRGVYEQDRGLALGTQVKIRWIAVDCGQAAPPNTVINETLLTEDNLISKLATRWTASFSLKRPTKGWPPGAYRVEVFIGPDQVGAQDFEIR
ncbi:MAG: hypothetical protein JXR96_10605 [Deltaproteobacteria bacterium]|nr:hypothetical protein [Deltaproteobacteria bacterium]